MPIMLWLKVGMMYPWRKRSFVRGVLQDDTDLCLCSIYIPITVGGALVLRSPQGDYVVIYMPLALEYAISVSLG